MRLNNLAKNKVRAKKIKNMHNRTTITKHESRIYFECRIHDNKICMKYVLFENSTEYFLYKY